MALIPIRKVMKKIPEIKDEMNQLRERVYAIRAEKQLMSELSGSSTSEEKSYHIQVDL